MPIRTPDDIRRDLFFEVGELLLGTRWADEFARLNEPKSEPAKKAA